MQLPQLETENRRGGRTAKKRLVVYETVFKKNIHGLNNPF